MFNLQVLAEDQKDTVVNLRGCCSHAEIQSLQRLRQLIYFCLEGRFGSIDHGCGRTECSEFLEWLKVPEIGRSHFNWQIQGDEFNRSATCKKRFHDILDDIGGKSPTTRFLPSTWPNPDFDLSTARSRILKDWRLSRWITQRHGTADFGSTADWLYCRLALLQIGSKEKLSK